jgi:hypothetical protein
MVKLKDILNYKINKCNNQISFDVKKREMKKFDLDIDDILDLKIKKEKIKW